MLELGKEYPPEGEGEAIAELAALHLKIHQVQPGPSLRGEHSKQHAGVWATFRVLEEIPDAMRVGLFAVPGSYAALVRFSNGRAQDDAQPDVHGMAVKVLVPNESGLLLMQDFVVADHPVFFARTVKHLLDFVAATASGVPISQIAADYPALDGFTRVATTSLLAMTYWSQTPYKLGAAAVKYVVTPSEGEDGPPIPLGQTPDCLRDALVEQLSLRRIRASFDLSVQPQTDASAMPVEDPTVEWTSAPVRLAAITIHSQDFDSQAQQDAFASLLWSPWHALPEHAPLGGINRARRRVYADSSALRHQTHGPIPPAVVSCAARGDVIFGTHA